VFFIKIASITSVIKINFVELGTMYIYLLPRILIYTLPVTFFIAVTISLYNLSKENETIVLFTLGYSPKKIARFFLTTSFILSTILIIDILVLIPMSKQLNQNFLDYKRVEAKFNIKATEFGQKFSDWLVYINEIDAKGQYKDVVMYQEKTPKEEQKLITSKSADVQNADGLLKLTLNDGKVFQISDEKINQVNFQSMDINSFSKNHISKVENIYDYWMESETSDKRSADLAFFVLIALFPLASVLFAISIGIVTYRYQKKNIYPEIFLIIGLYIGSITLLVKIIGMYTIPLVFFVSFALSYFLYLLRIKRRY
jgi:lipopolysaccharide export system permease protein